MYLISGRNAESLFWPLLVHVLNEFIHWVLFHCFSSTRTGTHSLEALSWSWFCLRKLWYMTGRTENRTTNDCSPEPQPPHVIVLWRRKVCAFEADCFVFCLFASYKNVKLAAFPHLTIKPLFSLGKSLTTRSSTIVLSKQHPQGDQKWFKPPVSCGQDLAMVEL